MTTRPTALSRRIPALACTIAIAAGGAVIAGTAGSAEAADTRPAFRVPFPCSQEWRGRAYDGHNPANAVDFNKGAQDDDEQLPVLAAGSGTVTSVKVYRPQYEGDTTYGYTVEIAHKNGWTSFYAHLYPNSVRVAVGDEVTSATIIGRVGKSGGQQYTHLHFEERLNGNDQPVIVGGKSFPRNVDTFVSRTC